MKQRKDSKPPVTLSGQLLLADSAITVKAALESACELHKRKNADAGRGKALPGLPRSSVNSSRDEPFDPKRPPSMPLPPLPPSPGAARTSHPLGAVQEAIDSPTPPLDDGDYDSESSIELTDILSTPLPKHVSRRRGLAPLDDLEQSSDSELDVDESIEQQAERELPEREVSSSPELAMGRANRLMSTASSVSAAQRLVSLDKTRTPEREPAVYSSSDEEDFDLSLDTMSSSQMYGDSSGASRLSMLSAASSKSSVPSGTHSPKRTSVEAAKRTSQTSSLLSPRASPPLARRPSQMPKQRQLEGPIELPRGGSRLPAPRSRSSKVEKPIRAETRTESTVPSPSSSMGLAYMRSSLPVTPMRAPSSARTSLPAPMSMLWPTSPGGSKAASTTAIPTPKRLVRPSC